MWSNHTSTGSPVTAQAYETVIEEIESMIRSKQLKLGDRLEGERVLADRLGVSRTSVREAIRVLATLGIIRSAPGSGPTAGAQVVADPEVALSASLRLHVAVDSLSVGDVIDARVMLESWAYRRLDGLSSDLLDRANELLEAMEQTDDPLEFHHIDTEFHLELVRLADNPLVNAIMSSLRASIESYVIDAAPLLEDWHAIATRLRAEHRAIVSALSEGSGERTALLAERHILAFARDAGLIT
jgi:GntR family transcriptional repressor for pyruvate dehydrogenase complex